MKLRLRTVYTHNTLLPAAMVMRECDPNSTAALTVFETRAGVHKDIIAQAYIHT